MADIQNLIKKLQSDDVNKRITACKELMMLPSLPREALEALQIATNDKNPGVVEFAQQALANHSEKNVPNSSEQTEKLNSRLALIFAAVAGFVAFFLTIWIPAIYIDEQANAQHPGAGGGATLGAFFLGTPLACIIGPSLGSLAALLVRRFIEQSSFWRWLIGPITGGLAGFISAVLLELPFFIINLLFYGN